MGVAAVVLAGGSGTRIGADRNKVLLSLGGVPSWSTPYAERPARPG